MFIGTVYYTTLNRESTHTTSSFVSDGVGSCHLLRRGGWGQGQALWRDLHLRSGDELLRCRRRWPTWASGGSPALQGAHEPVEGRVQGSRQHFRMRGGLLPLRG